MKVKYEIVKIVEMETYVQTIESEVKDRQEAMDIANTLHGPGVVSVFFSFLDKTTQPDQTEQPAPPNEPMD